MIQNVIKINNDKLTVTTRAEERFVLPDKNTKTLEKSQIRSTSNHLNST